jgi:hypothetical protein
MSYDPQDYVFGVWTPTFHIAGSSFPIINVVGFLFTYYCSLCVAIHLFERSNGRRQMPFFLLLFATVYFGSFVGVAIEYINRVAHWWAWRDPSPEVEDFVFYFLAWTWRSTLLFPIYLFFFIRPSSHKWRARLSLAIWTAIWFTLTPTIFVCALLPILAIKVRRPVVRLDKLQFSRAVPLRGRSPVF